MFYAFNTTSRITNTESGILFNEQDILTCVYKFHNDIRVDMNVSYQAPGFGVVLILDNTSNLAMTEDAYLFKVDSSDFSILRMHQNKQTQVDKVSSVISPSIDNKNQHLVLDIIGNMVTFTAYVRNSIGVEEKFVLGERKITGDLSSYSIGFYSNKGNTIKKISFEKLLPTGWKTSIDNTDGGYLGFIENGFYLENCLHDAEIEQDNITLQPGKYYLSFDAEKVNNIYDIDTYVIKQESPNTSGDEDFEDENKNIINAKDNSFTLEETSKVMLKFRGTNGKVSNVSIHTNSYGGYVATEEEPIKSDGSSIEINLNDVIKVEWQTIIKQVPEYNDYTKKATYGIVSTEERNYTLEDFDLKTGAEYLFEYSVEDGILTIKDTSDESVMSKREIELDEGSKTLTIMFNITAVIYGLKLYLTDKKEDDAILQRDVIKYVPTLIYSPIVIRHKTSGESLDISASYREEVEEQRKFILVTTKFSNGEVTIPGDLPDNSVDLDVYGIPSGAKFIDTSADKVDGYVDKYELITQGEYELTKGVVKLKSLLLNRYKYILIEYNDISNFKYVFTNYEREYFDIPTSSRTITLTKEVSSDNPSIIIYGIKNNSFFNDDYIYRVPENTINSLDYYCNDYNVISTDNYTADFKTNSIKFEKSVLSSYDHLIVDYMKKDSYAINLSEELAQYEVSMSSDQNDLEMIYDIHDDGTSAEYITKTIPDDKSNSFIVLRKTKEGDEDEN